VNELKGEGQGLAQYGRSGTNTSCFSELLTCLRNNFGYPGSFGNSTYLWCSAGHDVGNAYYFSLLFNDSDISLSYDGKKNGFCLRFVKD
jgi:hypothetical protein